MPQSKKKRAPLNRTLNICNEEIESFKSKMIKLNGKVNVDEVCCKIINQDLFDAIDFLPDNFVDLLFLDPPYNLNKKFSSVKFKEMKN